MTLIDLLSNIVLHERMISRDGYVRLRLYLQSSSRAMTATLRIENILHRCLSKA